MKTNIISKIFSLAVIAMTPLLAGEANAVSLGDSCAEMGQIRLSDTSAEGVIVCRGGVWVVPQKAGIGFQRAQDSSSAACTEDKIGQTGFDKALESEVVCTSTGWRSVASGGGSAGVANTATISRLLLVGGGGGGGGGYGGPAGSGGGAGEVVPLDEPFEILTDIAYQILPGSGGAFGPWSSAANGGFPGGNGGVSFAFGHAANGGGGGGGYIVVGSTTTANNNGYAGGSGGGSSYGTGGPTVKFHPNGLGYPGASQNGSQYMGGGGAGSTASAETGGSGYSSDITGATVVYGRGGNSGGGASPGASGRAGHGDGGNGGNSGNGGAGGSGVVIIRYPTSEGELTASGTYATATVGNDTVVTFTGSGTFMLSGGSGTGATNAPSCVDNASVSCLLSSDRGVSDPDLIAANIKSGVNILGILGTYGGSGFTVVGQGMCERGSGTRTCSNPGPSDNDCADFARTEGKTVWNRRVSDNVCCAWDTNVDNVTPMNCDGTWSYGTTS